MSTQPMPDTPRTAPVAGPDAPVVREAQPAHAYDATAKQKAGAKLARIPVKVQNDGPALKKPDAEATGLENDAL